MKKIINLLMSGLIVFSLSACGGNEGSEGEQTNADDHQHVQENENSNGNEDITTGEENTDVANETESNDNINQNQKLMIGDAANIDGLVITLNEARIEPGGEFDTPEHDQFIVVNLTAENNSEKEEIISSIMNLELRDTEGYTYNTTILLEGTKGQFDGTVEPGGKLRGEIPFDVPKSETYELHFSDPFGSDKVIWTIPSSDLQ